MHYFNFKEKIDLCRKCDLKIKLHYLKYIALLCQVEQELIIQFYFNFLNIGMNSLQISKHCWYEKPTDERVQKVIERNAIRILRWQTWDE